jgi:hypothetical protein
MHHRSGIADDTAVVRLREIQQLIRAWLHQRTPAALRSDGR